MLNCDQHSVQVLNIELGLENCRVFSHIAHRTICQIFSVKWRLHLQVTEPDFLSSQLIGVCSLRISIMMCYCIPKLKAIVITVIIYFSWTNLCLSSFQCEVLGKVLENGLLCP